MSNTPLPTAIDFSTLLKVTAPVAVTISEDAKLNVDNTIPNPDMDAELSMKYQKKTQYEHIIDLPDTYIGSIIAEQVEQHVFANVKTSKTTIIPEDSNKSVSNPSELMVEYNRDMITKSKIDYVPGLFKIFDEIIVNANDSRNRIDAKIANGEKGHSKMTTLKVNIFKSAGGVTSDLVAEEQRWAISVYNDGDGIDVAKHPVEQIWIPQMIFAELLTSGNYNKAEQKVTGGKNGYGAKLTNIFSTYFFVINIKIKQHQR
jgi:DNA topoisomerase-2